VPRVACSTAPAASGGPAPAIAVTGLTRRYRAQSALDDVSFTVPGGTITGLLGRNGAGKTTLLRVLAGQDFPSSGSVQVLGGAPAAPGDRWAVLRSLPESA
jgi:ABC-2 type transport system ATP-binding protein